MEKMVRGCLINRPIVIPAKAGIQAVNLIQRKVGDLDPRFRGGDDALGIYETTSRFVWSLVLGIWNFRTAYFSVLLILGAVSLTRAYEEPEPEPSTAPIGSSFYRHLAFDTNLDLRELEKFEKRGFGRGEIISLILISKATGTPLKDYGKRRMKDKVPLKDLAAEAHMDYPTLYKVVRAIKEGIESKGDSLLPPPVYETPPVDPNAKNDQEKQKKGEKAEPTPTPSTTPAPTPKSTFTPSKETDRDEPPAGPPTEGKPADSDGKPNVPTAPAKPPRQPDPKQSELE